MSTKDTPIGLQELIMKVKQELLRNPTDTQPLFTIKQLELEVSFTVERTADGSLDFSVVQGGASVSQGNVQTVKLTLDPILSADEMDVNLSTGQKHMAQKALTREVPDL